VVTFMLRPLYVGIRAPGTHSVEDWVGPRAGLDPAAKKKISSLHLSGIEPRSSSP